MGNPIPAWIQRVDFTRENVPIATTHFFKENQFCQD